MKVRALVLFTGKFKFLEAYMFACVLHTVQLSKNLVGSAVCREQELIRVTPFQNAWWKCCLFPVLKALYTE